MGIIEFFIFCVIIAALGYLATLALKNFSPNHPPIIDGIIWFVVVLFILVLLANAMGLGRIDPQIPRIR